MKYLPLVWTGLWRKPTRTVFTLLSIVVAFVLFGMVQGVNSAFDVGTRGANLNRLYVASKYSMIDELPLAMKAQIERVPGVTGVAYAVWFGGYYQDPKAQVTSFATNAAEYFKLYPELAIPKDQLEALLATRTGAVIGAELARKYGWKIGDRVPLSSFRVQADGSTSWPLDIVGIFDSSQARDANTLYFNDAYYNESAAFYFRNRVGSFIVGIHDPARAGQIGSAIDALFANSQNETHTQTEKEYAQAYLKQLGDINFIASAIVSAVFFTLLFLTGNTMIQSVRERIPEFAVLKTLGFVDRGIMALVVAESAILCIAAAVAGLGIATMLFPLLKDFVGLGHLPAKVVVFGIAVASILALIAAIPPALRTNRLSIVEALADQ